MELTDLSSAQLARVFNIVTGQTVTKFTNKTIGQQRLSKALEVTNTDLADALELTGIAPDAVEVDEAPEPEPPVDQYGFAHPERAKVEAKVAAKVAKAEAKVAKAEAKAAAKAVKAEAVRTAKAAKAEAKEHKPGRKEQVLDLLRRGNGATVAEIMEITGWLPHTTRAYLSKGGALAKAGITITSERIETDGSKTRFYRAT